MMDGQWMKKLAIHKMSTDLSKGGIGATIANLYAPGKLQSAARDGAAFAHEAVKLLREAKEPNPYKSLTDEEIAKVLVEAIEKRLKEVR